MKIKMFIAVACIVLMQLTAANAQISTNMYSGNNGATFSISIGTNTNLNKPNWNSNNNCYSTNNFNSCCNNNNFNNGCNSNHNCNSNANCCGQKHGCKNHKHKKHDNDCDNKKSKCCKKHDD